MNTKKKGICTVAGCGRVHRARGYCGAHYRRWFIGSPIDDTPIRSGGGPCLVNDCRDRVFARGYCRRHYNRAWRGEAPEQIARPFGRYVQRTTEEVAFRDEEGRKLCVRCNEWRDPSRYPVKSQSSDGLAPQCLECERSIRYATPIEDLTYLVELQGGACAICQEDIGAKYVIDHDHACCDRNGSCGECIRSILCGNCNLALGLLKEDVVRVERMVEYVTYWHSIREPRRIS